MVLQTVAVPCDLETGVGLIKIGRERENTAREVEFDLGNFEKMYGEGTVIAKYKRASDPNPYTLELDKDGITYTWHVSTTDTAVVGSGLLEFNYVLNDGTVVKSPTFVVRVLDAMDDGEIEPEVETSVEDYIKQVVDKTAHGTTESTITKSVEDYLKSHPVNPPTDAQAKAVIDEAIADGRINVSSALEKIDQLSDEIAVLCDANGKVISLSDSANMPIKEMIVYGRSTQDGTPSPSNPVEIESVENPDVMVSGSNLAKLPDGSITTNGVTVTVKNGDITIKGTATIAGGRVNEFYRGAHFTLPKGTYYINATVGMKSDVILQKYDGNGVLTTAKSQKFTLDADTEVYLGFNFEANTAYDETVNVTINVGDTALPYEVYKEPQSITVPYTLRGIPVSSGGNYTDADGQQWIADELHVRADGSGELVQRIAFEYDQSANTWNTWGAQSSGVIGFYSYRSSKSTYCGDEHTLCSLIQFDANAHSTRVGTRAIVINDKNKIPYVIVALPDKSVLADTSTNAKAVESFKAFMSSKKMEIQYALLNPTTTTLTAEEVKALLMQTYKPTTVIVSDADVAVKYIADPKAYIDAKFTELATALASK